MAEAAVVAPKARGKKSPPPPMAEPEMNTILKEVVNKVTAEVLEVYSEELKCSLAEDLEKRVARQLRKEMRTVARDLKGDLFSLSDAEVKTFAERIAPYMSPGGDGPTSEELLNSLDHTAFIQQLPVVAAEAFNGAILRAIASLSDDDRETVIDACEDDIMAAIGGQINARIRDAEDRGKDRVNTLIAKSDIRVRPKNAFHEIKLDVIHIADRPVGSWRRVVPAGTVGFFGYELARQTVLSDQVWAQHWAARVAAPIVAIFAVELLAWVIRSYTKDDDDAKGEKGEKKGKKTE